MSYLSRLWHSMVSFRSRAYKYTKLPADARTLELSSVQPEVCAMVNETRMSRGETSDAVLASALDSLPKVPLIDDVNSLDKASLKLVEQSQDAPGLGAIHVPASDNPYYVSDLEFTEEEESELIRILDKRLFSWVLLTTFVLNMDRANISNAISDNLPADLGFNINVINTATMIYAILFTVITPTGAVIAKKVGPPRCEKRFHLCRVQLIDPLVRRDPISHVFLGVGNRCSCLDYRQKWLFDR